MCPPSGLKSNKRRRRLNNLFAQSPAPAAPGIFYVAFARRNASGISTVRIISRIT